MLSIQKQSEKKLTASNAHLEYTSSERVSIDDSEPPTIAYLTIPSQLGWMLQKFSLERRVLLADRVHQTACIGKLWAIKNSNGLKLRIQSLDSKHPSHWAQNKIKLNFLKKSCWTMLINLKDAFRPSRDHRTLSEAPQITFKIWAYHWCFLLYIESHAPHTVIISCIWTVNYDFNSATRFAARNERLEESEKRLT